MTQNPAKGSAGGDDPTIPFDIYKLPNGLTVMLHEDHRVPLVHVNVWYRVGSMQEPRGRTGFAHLFEHLMFQGSRHVGDDDHFRLLEQAGASDVNGTTSFDRTNYFETVPSEELPLALFLESDRMGYLLDTLTQEKLDGQRAVVLNERRQNYEGAPYGLAYLQLQHALFPEGHPYHYPPIGKVEDLNAATLDDVKQFFASFYAPSNASLVVAGDFDKAKTKALIEKMFGGFATRPVPATPTIVTPPLAKETRTVVDEPIGPLPRVTIAWLTPPLFAPGDAELDVLSNILSHGKGSRLYQALVEKTQIAQDISAHQQSLMVQSIFEISGGVAPGKTPEELEKAIDAVLEDIAKNGPPADEVARAKTTMELELFHSMERISSRAEWLQTFFLYKNDPGYLPKHLAAYRAVTPESIQRVVRELLRKDARVVQYAIPKPNPDAVAAATEPEKAAEDGKAHPKLEPAEPWRAKLPDPLPPSTPQLPVAQRAVLDNGLTVLVVPRPGLPLVTWMAVTRAGAASDPVGKEGRSFLTAQMLTEGFEGGDAAAQSNQFAELGTQLGSTGGLEASQVFTTVHKRSNERALELLTRTIKSPTHNPLAFNRLQTRAVVGLEERLHDPMGVASHLWARTALGLAHPYGHPREGTVAGLKAVTIDDVRELHARAWTARNMAVVAVGDVTLERAVELVKEHFGALPTGELVYTPPAKPTVEKRSGVLAVEIKGAPQSVVVAVRPGVSVDDKDEPALSLLNAVLGGNFTSRLNLNLREAKGITYGAFSSSANFKTSGLLVAGAPVQRDATHIGIRELLAEIAAFPARPVTDEELHLAKQSYTRSLPGMFEGGNETAGSMARVFALDLPLDYWAQQPAKHLAVTLDDTNRMAATLLKPDEMKLLVVGDRSAVEKSATQLKLGEVRWMNSSGQPVVEEKPAKKKTKK